MKTTSNLGLKKPEGTDIVDINDLNGNMDILDTAVKAVQDHTSDTTRHITAAERTAWNAKANKSDIPSSLPASGGNADTVDGYHFNQALQTSSAPTFAGMSLNGNLNLASSAPIISLSETDQATNEKKWWIVPDSKMLQIRTVTDSDGSGSTAMSINRGTGTAIANISFNVPIVSNVSAGTAPLTITSSTLVSNLNADLLDGFHASTSSAANSIVVQDANQDITVRRAFFTATTGTAPFTVNSGTVVNLLNADKVDGYDFNQALLTNSTPTFALVTAPRFVSTQTTGTAPFMVASATVVTNLNADLLDGYQADSFVKAQAFSGTDFNEMTTSGLFRLGANMSNSPLAQGKPAMDYGQLLVMAAGGDTIMQLAAHYNSSRLVYRVGNPPQLGGSGAYQEWNEIYTSKNVTKSTAAPSGGSDGDIWLQYS